MATTAASPIAEFRRAVCAARGGAARLWLGGILSLHHYAIGICFVAGAAAFYVGKKLRRRELDARGAA